MNRTRTLSLSARPDGALRRGTRAIARHGALAADFRTCTTPVIIGCTVQR
jgi:hypothetical protein